MIEFNLQVTTYTCISNSFVHDPIQSSLCMARLFSFIYKSGQQYNLQYLLPILLYLLLVFLSNIGSLFIYMQTIQHSQVLLYVLTTTGSLYSSQKSTTNNIQLIAQYKQKTTSDHSNSLLRIYDLTLAADFLLYTDRVRRNS